MNCFFLFLVLVCFGSVFEASASFKIILNQISKPPPAGGIGIEIWKGTSPDLINEGTPLIHKKRKNIGVNGVEKRSKIAKKEHKVL